MVQDMKADQAGVEILISSILFLAFCRFPHFVIETRYNEIVDACQERGGRRPISTLPTASFNKGSLITRNHIRRFLPQASGES